MATFLLKTEPSEFSFADLKAKGRSRWDGVSNATANGHLRAIAPGDELLIYHTGDEKAIVGLARAVSGPMEDPARPGRTAKGDIKFVVIDVEAVRAIKTPLTLATMKADKRFEGFALLTQSRLSVMPVPASVEKAIRALTKG